LVLTPSNTAKDCFLQHIKLPNDRIDE